LTQSGHLAAIDKPIDQHQRNTWVQRSKYYYYWEEPIFLRYQYHCVAFFIKGEIGNNGITCNKKNDS